MRGFLQEPRDAGRILIITLRQIGDTLLTVPAIRAVRETYPGSYIAVLVNKGTEEMLTGNPLLDEVMVFQRSIVGAPVFERLRGELDFFRQIRQKKFDLVIALSKGDRTAIFSLLSGAKSRVAFDTKSGFLGKRYLYTNRATESAARMHAVERNIELVRAFGMCSDNVGLSMYWSELDDKFVDELFREHHVEKDDLKVHIHPVSNWLWNCWEDKSMASVIDHLSLKHHAKVFVTCGPVERERSKVDAILKLCESRPVNLTGRTTLKQLAALSSRCALFFGVNTGPMHIASAVGPKVVALIGYGDAVDWRPWGEGHVVISEEGVQPGVYRGMPRPKRIARSLSNISIEQVVSTLDRVLSVRNERSG